MKLSTKIALGFVGGFTAISLLSMTPNIPKTHFKNYKKLAVKKIIATKNIRSGSTGRSYSGGGSSYGK
ncbi:MAG: hypothetical protein L3J74_12110 [Bacteroidales bacterium]|nr:hypothetical protein [Bacteroidales bacterium]